MDADAFPTPLVTLAAGLVAVEVGLVPAVVEVFVFETLDEMLGFLA